MSCSKDAVLVDPRLLLVLGFGVPQAVLTLVLHFRCLAHFEILLQSSNQNDFCPLCWPMGTN